MKNDINLLLQSNFLINYIRKSILYDFLKIINMLLHFKRISSSYTKSVMHGKRR